MKAVNYKITLNFLMIGATNATARSVAHELDPEVMFFVGVHCICCSIKMKEISIV